MKFPLILLLIWQSCQDLRAQRVPVAVIAEDGRVDETQTDFKGRFEIPKNWSRKELSICMWIQPYRFLSNANVIIIIGQDPNDLDGIRAFVLEQKVVYKINKCSFEPDILLRRREWIQFCSSIYNNQVDFFTRGNKSSSYSNCKLQNLFSNDADKLFVSLGRNDILAIPFSGLVADIRLYWRSLTEDEAKKIASIVETDNYFVNVIREIDNQMYPKPPHSPQQSSANNTKEESQTDQEPDIAEISDRPKQQNSAFANSQNFNLASVFSILKDVLLFPSTPYMLLPINEKNTYNHSRRVCKIRQSSLPDFNIHGKDTLTNLIYDFLYFSSFSISSFWLNSINETHCKIGIYSFQNGSILVDSQNCTSYQRYMCVAKKDNPFIVLGYGKFKFEMYPVPYEIGGFETIDGFKIYFANNIMFFKELTKGVVYYNVPRIGSDRMIGKHILYNDEHTVQAPITLTACNDSEFTCVDGSCINMELVCNIYKDCDDKSDENVALCEVSLPPDAFYDKRLLPTTNFNKPTELLLEFEILRVTEVSIDKNTVEIFAKLKIDWQDPRLMFKFLQRDKGNKIASRNTTLYWQPEIRIGGAIHTYTDILSFTKKPGIMKAYSNYSGFYEIIGSFRAKLFKGENVTLSHEKIEPLIIMCNMDLFYFPFDLQICEFNITVANDYSDDIEVKTNESLIRLGYVHLTLYNIFGFEHYNISPQEITVVMKIRRKFGAYIFNTILPCIVLEIIGLMTHWLPINDYTDRVTVTLSCLIVMAALFTTSSNNLPESAEPKLIDIWMFAHIVVLLIVFIAHVIVIFIHDRKSCKEKEEKENGLKSEKLFRSWMRKQNILREESRSSPKRIKSAWMDFEDFQKENKNQKKCCTISPRGVNIFCFIFCCFVYCCFLILFWLTSAKKFDNFIQKMK